MNRIKKMRTEASKKDFGIVSLGMEVKSTINWDGILYNEKCFLYLLRLSSSFRLSSGTLKTSPREPFITLQDEMLLPINHHSISQI